MFNCFRALTLVLKKQLPISSYEDLVCLLDSCGADVGKREHSRKTASKMVKIMAEYAKQQARDYFRTTWDITGELPCVGMGADKMSAHRKQVQIVNIRFNNLREKTDIFPVVRICARAKMRDEITECRYFRWHAFGTRAKIITTHRGKIRHVSGRNEIIGGDIR